MRAATAQIASIDSLKLNACLTIVAVAHGAKTNGLLLAYGRFSNSDAKFSFHSSA